MSHPHPHPHLHPHLPTAPKFELSPDRTPPSPTPITPHLKPQVRRAPPPHPDLEKPYEDLRERAKYLASVYNDARIETDEAAFVAQFDGGLMNMVYAWCNGATFGDLCGMSDLFEGSIIRAIRRLSELLDELQSAAKAVGNDELYAKLNEARAPQPNPAPPAVASSPSPLARRAPRRAPCSEVSSSGMLHGIWYASRDRRAPNLSSGISSLPTRCTSRAEMLEAGFAAGYPEWPCPCAQSAYAYGNSAYAYGNSAYAHGNSAYAYVAERMWKTSQRDLRQRELPKDQSPV